MVKVQWRKDGRPSQEEGRYKIGGLCADHNGARLEVRVLSTVEEGLHVAWKVGRSGGELSAHGIVDIFDPLMSGILVTDGEMSEEQKKQALLSCVEWAKKRAAIIAEAWAEPDFKMGRL